MKKYLMGLIAIVLAIGFSAFQTDKKENKTTGADYFWYRADDSQITSDAVNATEVDKAAAMSTLTTCLDQNTHVCLVGSTDDSFGNGDPLPQDVGDNYIDHSN